MKRVSSLTAAATLLASPAFAGSTTLPPQPVVLPTMQVTAGAYSWSGPYAGISAGTTRTKQSRRTFSHRPLNKAELHDHINALGGCGSPGTMAEYTLVRDGDTWVSGCENIANNTPDAGWSEWQVVGEDETEAGGSETYRQSHSTWGLFAGYRHQFGSGFVLGGELAGHHFASETTFEAKAQAGYAIGRALPYLTAGWDFGPKEAIYGIGFDYALTDRWVTGIEYTRGHDTGKDRISARLSWRF